MLLICFSIDIDCRQAYHLLIINVYYFNVASSRWHSLIVLSSFHQLLPPTQWDLWSVYTFMASDKIYPDPLILSLSKLKKFNEQTISFLDSVFYFICLLKYLFICRHTPCLPPFRNRQLNICFIIQIR